MDLIENPRHSGSIVGVAKENRLGTFIKDPCERLPETEYVE